MKNRQPRLQYVYDRYSKATPSKGATVELRITYDYKQKYISTGIVLLPDQWRKGSVINHPEAMLLNQALDKMMLDTRKVILDMMNEGYLDIFSIPERLDRMNRPQLSFLDYCRQRATIRKYGKSKDSQQRYNRFIRLFEKYGKIREFEDISEAGIIAYDKYLIQKGLKPYSKWNNYHRFLNSFIKDAINDGYITKNPYRWTAIEKNMSTGGLGKYLTPEELKRIKNTSMPSDCLTKVRDVFIFQTYTCMSYSDLRAFNFKKVEEIRGMKVYRSHRKKTDKPFIIPILAPAWDILMKYNGRLPMISNANYNAYLKLVAQAAGVDKPVSSHWARHTGATLLLNEGVDMKIISKVCGHSSTRITEQIYAKLLDETVVDAVRGLEDRI